MRNVTITLEEDVALWARVEAARRHTSLSRFVAELLRERMGQDERYLKAMEGYLGRDPDYRSQGASYPRREDLYGGLRDCKREVK